MPTGKNVRIRFDVEGRRYVGVGFFGKGEALLGGDEILSRGTSKSYRPIGDEDMTFLWDYSKRGLHFRGHPFPERIQRYALITDQRNPDKPRDVCVLVFNSDRLQRFWYCLDYRWHDHRSLILCRLLPEELETGRS